MSSSLKSPTLSVSGSQAIPNSSFGQIVAQNSARRSDPKIPSNSEIKRPGQQSLKQHEDGRRVSDKYSLSSYRHPYDIRPPEPSANTQTIPTHGDNEGGQTQKRQGILEDMMQWYSTSNSGTHQIPSRGAPELTRRQPSTFSEEYDDSSAVHGMHRGDSTFSVTSFGSDVLDPDDPRLTGVKASQLDDQEDLEKNALRQMDYRARRKHIQRIQIKFNVTCEFCYLYHNKLGC